MNLFAKKLRLVSLIKEELGFTDSKVKSTYFGVGFVPEETYTVKLQHKELEKYDLDQESSAKILKKMSEEGSVVWFELNGDAIEVMVNTAKSQKFSYFAEGQRLTFIPETGEAVVNNIRVPFKPGNKDYSFMKLLSSNRSRYFDYEEIANALPDMGSFNKNTKKNIQILARDVKRKLKKYGIEGKLLEAKNGYRLLD